MLWRSLPRLSFPVSACSTCSGDGRVTGPLEGLPPVYGVDYQIICTGPEMVISKRCDACGGTGRRADRSRVPLISLEARQAAPPPPQLRSAARTG